MILERSHYYPLIRLTGQLIRGLPSNIKIQKRNALFLSHPKRQCGAPRIFITKNVYGVIGP